MEVHAQPDDVVEEHQPYSQAQLAEEARHRFHGDHDIQEFGDHAFDELQLDDISELDDVGEYASEQEASTREEIQAMGGRFQWGTKQNLLKGFEDPMEIGTASLDQDAGGQEAQSVAWDITSQQDEHYAREDVEVPSTDEAPPAVAAAKAKRTPRKSSKSAETVADVTENDSAQKTAKKPSTTRRTRKASYPSSLEENHARYGMDASGNRTPTRFQWWQRATSRDPRSKQLAQRAMVMRKAPAVRRLTAEEYWYKPLKLYTEK